MKSFFAVLLLAMGFSTSAYASTNTSTNANEVTGKAACVECAVEDDMMHELVEGKIQASMLLLIEEKKENIDLMINRMIEVQGKIGSSKKGSKGKLSAISQLITISENVRAEAMTAEKSQNTDVTFRAFDRASSEVHKNYEAVRAIIKKL